jgi:hypothetical protein
MIYRIRLGVPVFKEFYDGLVQKAQRHMIDKAEMTIIGVEPHPENRKKAGYAKVSLSNLPSIEKSDIVS